MLLVFVVQSAIMLGVMSFFWTQSHRAVVWVIFIVAEVVNGWSFLRGRRRLNQMVEGWPAQ